MDILQIYVYNIWIRGSKYIIIISKDKVFITYWNYILDYMLNDERLFI